uniref:Dehydrogenase/reductase SDR family member 4-like 2 isoform X4 n=1 Tax=Geotrypetes seraphini TaxID=260995 RepID=A0A6P8PJB1_GEOSA|nr:dehydrogenase/reductase SDR family member 4-like 2 isoform X4 [Geotrypetes seraphini]
MSHFRCRDEICCPFAERKQRVEGRVHSRGGMLSSFRILRPAVQSWPRMHSTAAQGVLADKVALVTASTDGIGLAIARRLAQDGAKVMLSSRKQENVDKTVAQLRAENLNVKGTVCHVGKEKDREGLVVKAVEEYGGIDILVSNAAVNPFFGNILDSTEEVWDKILDVNVKATFLLVKKVVPHMEKRGGGSIIIVSSLAAYLPFPNWRSTGLCWHSLFPLFARRCVHQWGDGCGRRRVQVPSLKKIKSIQSIL